MLRKDFDLLSRFFFVVLLIIPIISFSTSILFWLRYGIDIPFQDDWRQYLSDDMGRLDLNYLFKPANDTIYAVGQAFDSLAVRYLDGNTVAYQFMSLFLVMGSLLYLQWRLLNICLRDKLLAACSFSLTILMLQPDSYWGWQNMAYHQAIPLVCVLSILNLVYSKGVNSFNVAIFSIFLGFVSGFSYISGAIAVLALSFSLLLMGCFSKSKKKVRLCICGLSLLVPAIISSACQVWVIVGIQHGTHRADAPMAYPWESDFWLYFMGKVARSLMLPLSYPSISFCITVLIIIGVSIIAARGIFDLRRAEREVGSYNDRGDINVVFLCLLAVVLSYLMLISAGRANLRVETATDALSIFKEGFYRFHFFWATLIWPWVFAYILKSAKEINKAGLVCYIFIFFWLCGLFLFIKNTSVLSHREFYRETMVVRKAGIECLNTELIKSEPLTCSMLHPQDISGAIYNAEKINASFLSNIRFSPVEIGTNDPAPLFRLSESLGQLKFINSKKVLSNGSLLSIETEDDPMMVISVPNAAGMNACGRLEINIKLKVAHSDSAQVFFMPISAVGYSEKNSKIVSVRPDTDFQTISFSAVSTTGFVNEIRFDPVTSRQVVVIDELEIRCRHNLSK